MRIFEKPLNVIGMIEVCFQFKQQAHAFKIHELEEVIEVFAQQVVHRQVKILVTFLYVFLIFRETARLDGFQLCFHFFDIAG